MKIYVASSWRNQYQQEVVKRLRKLGHQVYDFKNPKGDGLNTGFHWSEIDPHWLSWTPEEYVKNLRHVVAERGFNQDFDAMKWADCCVMVMPCGRSANTEAGWMKGAGKEVHVFMPTAQEPELMYKIYDSIITDFDSLNKHFEIKEAQIAIYNIFSPIANMRDYGMFYSIRVKFWKCIPYGFKILNIERRSVPN